MNSLPSLIKIEKALLLFTWSQESFGPQKDRADRIQGDAFASFPPRAVKTAKGMVAAMKKKTIAAAVFSLLLAFSLLYRPNIAATGVKNGLTLCGNVVIPSLFPFLVLSNFLTLSPVSQIFARCLRPLTRLLRLPEAAGLPLFLSFVGGYPASSVSISQLVESHRLSSRDAQRMTWFCVNAGPSFLIGAVGSGLCKSVPYGVILYLSQVLSSLAIGLAVGRLLPGESDSWEQQMRRKPLRAASTGSRQLSEKASEPLLSYPNALVQSVSAGCQGMLSICAFVILFAAVLALCGEYQIFYRLARLFPLSPAVTGAVESLFSGLLEVTSGCAAAAQCPGFLPLLVIPFLTSFSGLSVIFQIFHIYSGVNLPMRGFVLSRLIHGPLTAAAALLLLKLFPGVVQSLEAGKKAMDSFAAVSDITLQSSAHSLWGMAFLVLSMAFFLLSVTGSSEKLRKMQR